MSSETTWTVERDEALRLGWTAGKTAEQIAADLGGFEHLANGGKNAVVGRAHRLKLPSRRVVMTPEEKAERRVAQSKKDNDARRARRRSRTGVKRKAKASKPVAATSAFVEESWVFATPMSDLRDFSRHRPNQCRYPDPKDEVGPNYMCCGVETETGETYCGRCRDICSPPRQPRSYTVTEDQREALRVKGQVLGFANIRAGRSYGRTFTPSMVPVVNGEAIV